MAQVLSQFGLSTVAQYNDDGSVFYPIRSGGEVIATAARIGSNGFFEINSERLSIRGEVRARMRHNGGVLWFISKQLETHKPAVAAAPATSPVKTAK